MVCYFVPSLSSIVRFGWMMTCDFASFSTVFQSYQDDGRLIMKSCEQGNSVYGWEDFASSGDRTRSARSVGQRLTHWATGLLFALESHVLTKRICRLCIGISAGRHAVCIHKNAWLLFSVCASYTCFNQTVYVCSPISPCANGKKIH